MECILLLVPSLANYVNSAARG